MHASRTRGPRVGLMPYPAARGLTHMPQVIYCLEGEKMKFDTSTDVGRRFKESWLDRIVMDKRAIRADMALRHKI